MRAFARRSLRQYTRSPIGLAFLVAWPAFWYLVVAHVLFGRAVGAVGVAKAAFAVSFGLFGALTVSLAGAVGSFTADVQAKRYRKFRSMPIVPAADFTGRFLAGAALSMGSYGSLLAIGALDGAAFGLRAPWSPAVVVLSVAAFAAVGVATALGLAALVPRPEHATTLATALLMLVLFGTGFNGVSPALFPGPDWLLNVIPVTVIARVQLYHLVEPAVVDQGAFAPPALPAGPGAIVLLVAYGAGSLALGAWALARLVYRGEAGE
ncbi:MAG: ABC transporter permease [Halobacteriales archaeon]